ncbi:hypothetical protein BJX64DRAFT_290691 [Aspergillus heterothallicus]
MFNMFEPIPISTAPVNILSMSKEPALGASLAARVARVLDTANVPYVLWGLAAAALVAEDGSYPELEFVISDASIQQAIKALKGDGICPCDDPKCPELLADRADGYASDDDSDDPIFMSCDRYHPIGSAHFHFKTRVQCLDQSCRYYSSHPRDEHGQYYHDQFLVLHLLRQSEILFWMDPLKPGSPTPNVILSNDPALPAKLVPRQYGGPGVVRSCLSSVPRVVSPSGPWNGLDPVKILDSPSYVESIIWLLCRDMNPDERGDVPILMRRWMDLSSKVRRRIESVGGRFQPAWQEMVREAGKVHGPVVRGLRNELIRNGELPSPGKPTPESAKGWWPWK